MNDRKETIVLFVFVVVFISTVFLLCSGRKDVHNLRERAGNTGKQLETVIREQRKERAVIDRTERAVRKSERLNREIERIERTDREIITENQEILRRIRARGGKENQN